MNQVISPLIQPDELLSLPQEGSFILIDARAGASIAHDQYLAKHLAGAQHVDLDKQLADVKPNPAEGGRHPLPAPAAFADLLQELGVSAESHVIVYDDKNAANAAARFWWMMKAAGHEKTQVINGGLNAAIAAGFPVSADEENKPARGSFKFDDWALPLVDIDGVAKAAAAEDHLVIDVRDAYRYRGESEPIDLVAGHIPGAENIPFSTNLDEQGFFLSPLALKEKYIQALAGRPVENTIIHCGSGVTACHTILAMAYAEMQMPSLYVGSWSEWSRNDRPIATTKI